jgi:hypothetical protein
MEYFKRGYETIRPHLAAYVIYTVVCAFVSGMTLYIPILSTLREFFSAVKENRAPEIGNALNIDVIKNDIMMWLALLGAQMSITVIAVMLIVPFVVIGLLLGSVSEILTLLTIGLGYIVLFVAVMLVTVLLFLAPFIYIEENLEPLDVLKASAFYSKTKLMPIVIHLILMNIIVTVSAMFCYFPIFITLPIVAVANVYFYDAHRSGIQSVIQERQLISKS